MMSVAFAAEYLGMPVLQPCADDTHSECCAKDCRALLLLPDRFSLKSLNS